MRTEPIRVGILEDQQVFRECLVMLLESAGMKVVVRGSDPEVFLAQVVQERPDVALVDVRFEGRDNAEVGELARAVELLRNLAPYTRSLVHSTSQELMLVQRCLQAGAYGHVCKLDVGCAKLLSSIEQVARGERLVPPRLVSPVLAPSSSPWQERLTGREQEVLGMVAAGADNLQISAHLGITERTVKAHISNLYRKLGVRNRVAMALLAVQKGVSSQGRTAHS